MPVATDRFWVANQFAALRILHTHTYAAVRKHRLKRTTMKTNSRQEERNRIAANSVSAVSCFWAAAVTALPDVCSEIDMCNEKTYLSEMKIKNFRVN